LTEEHLLDNPVWHALNAGQAAFGETNALAARYRSAISPLGALREPTLDALEALASLCGRDPVVVLTAAAELPPISRMRVVRSVALKQMSCETAVAPVPVDAIRLGADDVAEVLALVALTQPGPFAQRTLELGHYLGVRVGGRLLAMTGERLKPPGWTEVSGVCTHPDGRGHGYALALVIAVTNAIIAKGERAFLHVAIGSPSEMTATRVYERAGFRIRREMYIHALAPN
jgi:predicted GNAT family acetyltransferase